MAKATPRDLQRRGGPANGPLTGGKAGPGPAGTGTSTASAEPRPARQEHKALSVKKTSIIPTYTGPNSRTAVLAIVWHLPLHTFSLRRVQMLTTPQNHFSKNTGKSNACNDVACKLLTVV